MNDKAKTVEEDKRRKELIFEAFEFVQTALKMDPENFAVHKVRAFKKNINFSRRQRKQCSTLWIILLVVRNYVV